MTGMELKFRDYRMKAGLTLEQVAERLDMSHSQISRIERGASNYTPKTLQALADLYGVHRSALLDDRPDIDTPDGDAMIDENQEFAARLNAARETKGWSQSELSRRAGVKRDSISQYCLGHQRPNDGNLAKLANALGCEPADLSPPRAMKPGADKGSRGNRTLRFDRGLYEWISKRAEFENRTISNMVETALMEYRRRHSEPE